MASVFTDAAKEAAGKMILRLTMDGWLAHTRPPHHLFFGLLALLLRRIQKDDSRSSLMGSMIFIFFCFQVAGLADSSSRPGASIPGGWMERWDHLSK